MTIENWKPIAGYEGLYEVSDQGRVRGLDRIVPHPRGGHHRRRAQFMRPGFAKGYLSVRLCRNGVMNSFAVHRLVAEAFIPNPESKSQVNHLSGEKTNNCVTNLEWCSRTENAIHARDVLKIPHFQINTTAGHFPSRPVIALSSDGRFSMVFGSSSDASRSGFDSGSVSKCCRGLVCRHAGYTWRYLDEVAG